MENSGSSFLKFGEILCFDEMTSVADEKGVGLKGWLSGPRRKTPLNQLEVEKLAPSDKHRIAVLPMGNITPDQRDEYFAEGITDELIATISKIPELHSNRENHLGEVQRLGQGNRRNQQRTTDRHHPRRNRPYCREAATSHSTTHRLSDRGEPLVREL